PPHKINYRANIWALHQLGVSEIIAVNAVGGIGDQYPPRTIAVPDQLIDYTYGRDHSFFDGGNQDLTHIDFTWPYSARLRQKIINAASRQNIDVVNTGTYACTNGPRLETAAEVRKIAVDGCNMIGMTGMPEAALARESGLEYAAIALVVNWCAGLNEIEVSMDEIRRILEQEVNRVRQLILASVGEVSP
ncbi:MAG: S-methyl-5'-thioinosine phosphorylase, partial [Gammaproteobacteria bacterium]|nr:S-methyl-5'-thioinosine phosphorylase [Gammaproteobacteria bacterium]